jgi:uncharacterized protein GlcG (DUF336 family)
MSESSIHGNVVFIHRMTGAPAFSVELSERKAYTSALVGGVPLTSAGQVIAGVGVSGGTTEQDIAIVEAATNSS